MPSSTPTQLAFTDAPAAVTHAARGYVDYGYGWDAYADLPPMQAAGLLPRYTDADGEQWFLLAKRGRACRSGGRWANFGGELDLGETPMRAAVREFTEETGLPVQALAGATVGATIETSSATVDYTLFVLDVPVMFGDVELTWENDDCWWFNPAGVDELPLHDGFARCWTELQASA